MEISTSILSVNKEDAIRMFYNIETAKTDYFHIDVMDGKFVEKDTTEFMLESAETLKQISNIPLDVHLMVEDVENFIDVYIPLKPCFITFHFESVTDKKKINDILKQIKDEGIKAGISIKPETSINEIEYLLPYVNLVLIMTVEPGLGGQKIIPKTINKIKELDEYRKKKNLDFYIEADGGINLETVKEIRDSGTDIAVAGTAIIKSDSMKDTIKALKK